MQLVAGVIGCGSISRFHFSGLEKAGVKIKWVCDLVEQNARPYAERFNAQYTADWKQVVADPQVNTVVITALSFLHKPMCLAAIEAGKAVKTRASLLPIPRNNLAPWIGIEICRPLDCAHPS